MAAVLAATVLSQVPPAQALIDPERPISWLVGECRAVAALKVSAVGKQSATFAVTKVLLGKVAAKTIVVRWAATQKPPVDTDSLGAEAVLLVPKDKDQPALVHVSPEYLSVRPAGKAAGTYEFLRPNGFVKGSFNGASGDLIALIADIAAERAYFPIWADTSFAKARRIGDLPAPAGALAVGDLDGDGTLEVLASTAKGLVAFTRDAKGRFAALRLSAPAGGAAEALADANGDGRLDLLTDSGLFLRAADGRFAPAAPLAGRKWTSPRFCYLPGRTAPAIACIEAGRARLLARDAQGRWADVTGAMGLDKAPAGILAMDVADVGGRLAVVLASADAVTCWQASKGNVLQKTQTFSLVEADAPAVRNLRVCQADLNGDGIADLACAWDGASRIFRRQADGRLIEIQDYLGDVRNVFRTVSGLGGLIGEDFNNDGLTDLVAWAGSPALSLVMNRGYHNLRGGTEIFDLPAAAKPLSAARAAAAADIDDDGDLDFLVADDKALHLLANTFETKPDEANDRPRRPLIKVLTPRFGEPVRLVDAAGRTLAARRVGTGPVAGVLYFAWRAGKKPTVVLTAGDGKVQRKPADRIVRFK